MSAGPALLRLLAGERTAEVPVVPLLGAAAAPLAGVPLLEAFTDPALQSQALVAAHDLLQPAALFPFMDLTAEPEALGASLRWRGDLGPEIDTPLTPEELARALRGAAPDAARLPVLHETVSTLSRRLGHVTAVGAYVPGPWTLVASTLGLAQAARIVRRDPDLVAGLIREAGALLQALLARYGEAGAALVMVLEPCVAGGLLGPQDCTRLVLPVLEGLLQAGARRGLPVVLHVCGAATHLLPLLLPLPCAGLSLDAPVDLPSVARQAPAGLSLWGNLAPVELLLQGSPEAVSAACCTCLAAMPPGAPHVLASGCEVPLHTPLPNLLAMAAAGRA